MDLDLDSYLGYLIRIDARDSLDCVCMSMYRDRSYGIFLLDLFSTYYRLDYDADLDDLEKLSAYIKMGLYVRCRGISVFLTYGGIIGSTMSSVMDPSISSRSPLKFLDGRVFILRGFYSLFTVTVRYFGDYGGFIYDYSVYDTCYVYLGVLDYYDLGYLVYDLLYSFLGFYFRSISSYVLYGRRAMSGLDIIFGRKITPYESFAFQYCYMEYEQ